ncbi:hypothetical protein EfmAA610_29450 [Enterococcus faecium]|nr:hypothetical protein EfmAA610_29450 [Enterococcus faecium]
MFFKINIFPLQSVSLTFSITKIQGKKLVKNANKEENKDYFAASDGIDVIYLEGQSEKGKEDPHAWLNLENGIIYAKNIEKQLAEKDPDNKKIL